MLEAAGKQARRWHKQGHAVQREMLLEAKDEALRQLAPEGGTSLYHAFSAAKALNPPPDNILLITDGLPTQGRSKPVATTVTADKRLDHFEQAVKLLDGKIPVNTILLPMEGDAWAAAAFWQLAINSEGSFMTPSRDWPRPFRRRESPPSPGTRPTLMPYEIFIRSGGICSPPD